MGFFSWKTQDTNQSIANTYSARPTFQIKMMDNKGNVWTEYDYEGYGEFGGKDFYELLDEMNGGSGERDRGIKLAFKNNSGGDHTPEVLYPNLVENSNNWTYNPKGPESCPDQGYFYDDVHVVFYGGEEIYEEDF
jgi:hypothetical protein